MIRVSWIIRTGFVILFTSGALLGSKTAVAVEPDEILSDPELEARARALSATLRCLVCRNETIDESNADLARDLRLLVRERLQTGESDEQILAHIRERYGDYVLFDPPFMAATLLLWGGPALLFVIGLWLALARLGSRITPAPFLDADTRHRASMLLATSDEPEHQQDTPSNPDSSPPPGSHR